MTNSTVVIEASQTSETSPSDEINKSVDQAVKSIESITIINETTTVNDPAATATSTATANNTENTTPSQSNPTPAPAPPTSSGGAWGSSKKSWSSLFNSQQAAAAAAAAQAAAQSSSSKSSSKNPKSPLSVSTSLPVQATHTNGNLSETSSSSSVSAATSSSTAASVPPQPLSIDALKTLGTHFKQCELKHSAPALQPRGIINKQNWCYVNATLQALLACPPFYNLIKSIFTKIKKDNINGKLVPCISALGRFIYEFKVMVRNSEQSNKSSGGLSIYTSSGKELILGEPFEIDYFYETLANLKAELSFKMGRQEDAQEFLSFLLNRLHEEMVKCLESLNPASQTATASNNQNDYSKTNGNSSSKAQLLTMQSQNHKDTNNNTNNNNDEQDEDEWKEVGKKIELLLLERPNLNNLHYLIYFVDN